MSSEGIEADLRRVQDLPVAVSDWHVETGEDSTGDDAVWVWVTLEDETFDDSAMRDRVRSRVREIVRESLGRIEPWVYVRFRAASEADA